MFPPSLLQSQNSFKQPKGKPNVVEGNGGFSSADKATHPADTVQSSKHIFVVDSRQRNFKQFPNADRYRIRIGDVYKNVNSIELKAAILPKTEYNVHSTNKYIDFALSELDPAYLGTPAYVGQPVTGFKVVVQGSGYLPTPPFGPAVGPLVVIGAPTDPGGVQATANANVNKHGQVYSIVVTVSGSGYRAGNPPLVTVAPPPVGSSTITAKAEAICGLHLTAELRGGQYDIGGNPGLPGTVGPCRGLVKEIQNALNFAVNGGVYNFNSISPFEVRLVSQYPDLSALPGTPDAQETNACLFNRIQITNVGTVPGGGSPQYFELLWASGGHAETSAHRVLGFEWSNVDPVLTPELQVEPVVGAPEILIHAGQSCKGKYDWNLNDDPKYLVLSFWPVSNGDFERVESENEGLNGAFACLVFDANSPNNLSGLGTTGIKEPTAPDNSASKGGTTVPSVGGVMPGFDSSYQLWGEVGKGTWWKPPGLLKGLKGSDFDKKIIQFSPPLGKLSFLDINFTKYGCGPGGKHYPYDFQGRDHLLIFEFGCSDQNSQNRY